MTFDLRILGAGLALALSACTTPTAGGPQTVAAMTGPNGEPVVCRDIKVTGTRFPQKVCKTAEVWESYDDYTNSNAKESTDKFQRITTGCSTQSQGAC